MPLTLYNSEFKQAVLNVPVVGEDSAGNMVPLGKVLTQINNIGIAMVDINKLDSLGGNAKYTIGSNRAVVWHPDWLEIEQRSQIDE